MDLKKAQALAIEQMKAHGVYPEWSFKFDRSKSRHGYTRVGTVRGYPVKEISLSKYITERATEDTVLDTILHEIAHALVGVEHMHDEVWYAKAVAIGSKGRLFTDEEIEIVYDLAQYKYHCSECGIVTTYGHRKLKNHGRCADHPTSEKVLAVS